MRLQYENFHATIHRQYWQWSPVYPVSPSASLVTASEAIGKLSDGSTATYFTYDHTLWISNKGICQATIT